MSLNSRIRRFQMVAPKGNNFAKKLKTPELKEEAYRQYCEHLAKGKSKRSWYFEHPELTMTWETMEKYIAQNKQDFEPIKKEIAESKGFAIWEEICELSAQGKNKAVTPSLQMVMRNKFNWDKETRIEHSFEPEARRLLNKWES